MSALHVGQQDYGSSRSSELWVTYSAPSAPADGGALLEEMVRIRLLRSIALAVGDMQELGYSCHSWEAQWSRSELAALEK